MDKAVPQVGTDPPHACFAGTDETSFLGVAVLPGRPRGPLDAAQRHHALCIDTSNAPRRKVGNEKKLQVVWQNFPVRPQHIFILGTSFATRIAVNALIAFASLFAKNKVISRIQFSDVDAVGRLVGRENLPALHGGATRPLTSEWVAQRLADFPRMGLPVLK